MTWYNAVTTDQLAEGQTLEVTLDGLDIILVNTNHHYYAIENRCSHDHAKLAGGEIEDEEIVCPRHGARFCLASGEATCPPAFEAIETFEVRVKDGMIQILVD